MKKDRDIVELLKLLRSKLIWYIIKHNDQGLCSVAGILVRKCIITTCEHKVLTDYLWTHRYPIGYLYFPYWFKPKAIWPRYKWLTQQIKLEKHVHSTKE